MRYKLRPQTQSETMVDHIQLNNENNQGLIDLFRYRVDYSILSNTHRQKELRLASQSDSASHEEMRLLTMNELRAASASFQISKATTYSVNLDMPSMSPWEVTRYVHRNCESWMDQYEKSMWAGSIPSLAGRSMSLRCRVTCATSEESLRVRV